jgi:hypothetical protein
MGAERVGADIDNLMRERRFVHLYLLVDGAHRSKAGTADEVENRPKTLRSRRADDDMSWNDPTIRS